MLSPPVSLSPHVTTSSFDGGVLGYSGTGVIRAVRLIKVVIEVLKNTEVIRVKSLGSTIEGVPGKVC